MWLQAFHWAFLCLIPKLWKWNSLDWGLLVSPQDMIQPGILSLEATFNLGSPDAGSLWNTTCNNPWTSCSLSAQTAHTHLSFPTTIGDHMDDGPKLYLSLSCWREGQHEPQRIFRKRPVDLRSRAITRHWGQLLTESREEHSELEGICSFNYAWRTRLSSQTLKVVFDKKSCYYFSTQFEKQHGSRENLILEKLFCSPHQLNNVNMFAKMKVKRILPDFTRDGNG